MLLPLSFFVLLTVGGTNRIPNILFYLLSAFLYFCRYVFVCCAISIVGNMATLLSIEAFVDMCFVLFCLVLFCFVSFVVVLVFVGVNFLFDIDDCLNIDECLSVLVLHIISWRIDSLQNYVSFFDTFVICFIDQVLIIACDALV